MHLRAHEELQRRAEAVPQPAQAANNYVGSGAEWVSNGLHAAELLSRSWGGTFMDMGKAIRAISPDIDGGADVLTYFERRQI